MNFKLIELALALTIVGLIAMIYWPVADAGFVWDDKICFQNAAWLRYGDDWRHFIFHNFYDWTNYFRPLVVAFFAAEVRAFDVAPGPMHMVSLGIHLANTLLVGAIALRLSANPQSTSGARIVAGVAMLIYGLHPALIEPVVWISCQADLLVTFFMLLGLLLNAVLQNTAWRAITVAMCFFLAAGAKESAAVFPLLLLLLDVRQADSAVPARIRMASLRSLLQYQWPVYLSVFAAGLAYLALRAWALGALVQGGSSEAWLSWPRFQTVCFTYLTYWRIIVWPMIDLGPTHLVDMNQFSALGTTTSAIDIGALTVFFLALYAAWKRKPVGYLVLGGTVALFPVLHLIPVGFIPSLYHERYAMMGVAISCALLPCVINGISLPQPKLIRARLAASVIATAWFCVAIVNVRVTLPLWSNETKLWLWALEQHPDSVEAKDHLLSTYLEQDDRPRARKLAAQMMIETQSCTTCMINIANLSFADGDAVLAKRALEQATQSMHAGISPRLVQAYIVAVGQLSELEHDALGAETAYRDAVAMDPFDTQARMNLVMMLAKQGRAQEARKAMDEALPLLAPAERAERRRIFEQALTTAGQPREAPPTVLQR